jgi:long-chain acyl-CoA synthetase
VDGGNGGGADVGSGSSTARSGDIRGLLELDAAPLPIAGCGAGRSLGAPGKRALDHAHPRSGASRARGPCGDAFAEWSAARFVDTVEELAKGLIGLGIEPGDRVALHSATRPEFTLLDYAIWAVGAVSVPLYETSSAEQVAWILEDSGARMLLSENEELRDVFTSIAERVTTCEQALTITQGGLDALRAAGQHVESDEVHRRCAAIDGSSVATLVYTSGTTGRPKGCVLTHGNLLWDAVQVAAAGDAFFVRGARTLLFLPLAHIFARVVQVSAVRAGVTLGYSTGLANLSDELAMFRPDFVLAVPRVFEKVYNGARQKAVEAGRGGVFDRAAATAERWSRERQAGRLSARTRVAHALFDRLVFARLREALGGRVAYAISGGAALGERLGHFLNGVGITVLEGYGLTETSAGATINRPDAQRIGSVGKPVPGASVRIAEDGEIELAGPHIFRGYHGDDAATREVLSDDGWFRSGDLGHLDGEGYLFITGRKKELLVTAAGKNVAPNTLEDPLRAHPLISQAVVVGDARPFVAALITLDVDALGPWLSARGRGGPVDPAALVDDADLLAELDEAVTQANRMVSRAESIRAFRVLPQDFTVGVELSQKMSLRRHVITERYAAEIDALYTSGSAPSGTH